MGIPQSEPKVQINPELIVPSSPYKIERMVQIEKLRKEFASRLIEAARAAGISEWGLGARLAEMTGRTQKAASKWINAETMPGRANMEMIAAGLGVRTQWLQYGEPPREKLQNDQAENMALAAKPAPARATPSDLDSALLAAMDQLTPLQKADVIAYARQLSGAQPQPSRPAKAVRDYLDEPLTASADEPERRRQDEGPPAGVERRAKP